MKMRQSMRQSLKQKQDQTQGRWVQKWRVESNSSAGKFYTVSVSSEMKWGCSCPVWIFRRDECQHIKEIKLSLKLGDDSSLMRLMAIRIEKLKRHGKTDEEIAAILMAEGDPIEAFVDGYEIQPEA